MVGIVGEIGGLYLYESVVLHESVDAAAADAVRCAYGTGYAVVIGLGRAAFRSAEGFGGIGLGSAGRE